jgi:hypothetical protein
VKPKKRFVLPFEKSSNLDLGLAICRESFAPIEIKLYDQEGNLADQVTYNPPAYHSAAFSFEIFGPVSISAGIVILESEGLFAPMGLRFGNGVLAGLPVDEAKDTSQYWAEKMCEPSGSWFFDYTISTVSTKRYTMYEVAQAFQTDPKYVAYGRDQYDGEVIIGLTDENQLLLVDPSIVFDYVYSFTFTSDNNVAGCMYMRNQDSGALGTCWPLSGRRIFNALHSSEQFPNKRTDSISRIAEEETMFKGFVPAVPAGSLTRAVDRLMNQASPR